MSMIDAFTRPPSARALARIAATFRCAIESWMSSIAASHHEYSREQERLRRFKRSLPVTPFQLWFYRTAIGSLVFFYGLMLLGGGR